MVRTTCWLLAVWPLGQPNALPMVGQNVGPASQYTAVNNLLESALLPGCT